jgi:tetratricopeptide (TPR) repeat protein
MKSNPFRLGSGLLVQEGGTMLTDHSRVEDFEGFLRAPKAPGNAARNTRMVRHLLAGCDPCQESLSTAVSNRAGGYDYSKAFAGAQSSLSAFLAKGAAPSESSEILMAEIAAMPAEARAQAVRESRYAHPAFIRHLIDASHEIRYQDPAGMLRLSELARVAAEGCGVEASGSEKRLSDLRGQSWRQYGNALRILGRLPESEEAFATAQRHLDAGTLDPLLHARLCTQTASLRYFQRRFAEAVALADEAGQIYAELGEKHSCASSMVQKAIASLYAGEAEDAVRILNQAIPLIDADGDTHLLLAACHNLVRCYIDLGRPEQALSIYSETRELYKKFADPLIRLRVAWQEGQLLRDMGHLRASEAVLLQARQGFVERNLLYEAALISLDLAAVYVRLQDEQELRQAVAETVPIFRALGVDREALASLLQLQQLSNQSRQALELIRLLNGRIEQIPSRQALL